MFWEHITALIMWWNTLFGLEGNQCIILSFIMRGGRDKLNLLVKKKGGDYELFKCV